MCLSNLLEEFCVSYLFVKPPVEVTSFVKPRSIHALSQLWWWKFCGDICQWGSQHGNSLTHMGIVIEWVWGKLVCSILCGICFFFSPSHSSTQLHILQGIILDSVCACMDSDVCWQCKHGHKKMKGHQLWNWQNSSCITWTVPSCTCSCYHQTPPYS